MSHTQQHPLAGKALAMLASQAELLKRAGAMHEEKQASAAAVSKLIPAVVEKLASADSIQPGQKEKVAEALKDPAMALELFNDFITMQQQQKQASLGEVVDSGNGNGQSVRRSNTVGAPITNHDDTEAGRQFRNRIMHPGN